MKKIISLVLAIILTVSLIMVSVFADTQITVTLNGEKIEFDVPPQIIDNRTMVPMRAIFEAMGATVDWNETIQWISARREDTTVGMMIGDREIIVNGRSIELDVPPMIVDNRTLVPVRAVAESFDAEVEWDAATQTVIITVVQRIVLPNRRLTDEERQEWIDEYWAFGGPTANELEVVRLVNEVRAEHGLSQLEVDYSLMMAARFFGQQAHDLRGLHTGTHNFGPYADENSRWAPNHGASYYVARAFGGRLRWGGGNWFSGGSMTAEALVAGWMNSEGHRRYILSPEHMFIGAGQFPGGISYLFLSDQSSQSPTTAFTPAPDISLNVTITIMEPGAAATANQNQTIIATVSVFNHQGENITSQLYLSNITITNGTETIAGNLDNQPNAQELTFYFTANWIPGQTADITVEVEGGHGGFFELTTENVVRNYYG